MIGSGPLEDRLAIRELVESYNDAVMRFDGDAWRENWLEDATWSLPGLGDLRGREKFFPIWQGMMAGFSFVGFHASAGPIAVHGDTARATWWQQELLHGKDGSRRAVNGRYDDEYAKRAGRWYFARRAYQILNARELRD